MLSNETEGLFNGIETVEIGDLDDVKEIKTTIPATKGVKVKIVKAETKINKQNTYRSINLQLKIVDGIDMEGKYKGKIIFARVCYFADPNAYTKDFFRNKQHLIGLKQLIKATGLTTTSVTSEWIDQLVSLSPAIKVDIIQKKRKMMVDDGTGTQQEVEVMENDVRNFQAIDISEQV